MGKTIEEAIKYFKNHIQSYCVTGVCKEAEELAIEALKKQVPMKSKHYDSVPHARCPKCNNAVKLYCDGREHHHCKRCGQKLDWSEEK